MNKFDKNIDNICQLVGELPQDYDHTKRFIIDEITKLNRFDTIAPLNSWLYGYIYNLPNEKSWKRKHIYLLVHELLEIYSFHSGVDDILYDVESGIIGNCAAGYIKKYLNEPEDIDALEEYVRNYDWL